MSHVAEAGVIEFVTVIAHHDYDCVFHERGIAHLRRACCEWYSRNYEVGGMSASELKRLKETEAELSQYKRMYAELARENYALKDLIEKNVWSAPGLQ